MRQALRARPVWLFGPRLGVVQGRACNKYAPAARSPEGRASGVVPPLSSPRKKKANHPPHTHTLATPHKQVELKTGETYRGDLAETEDNWNLQLKNVTATARDGRVSRMEHVFVRGAKVR